tara:strand:- start:370 stop:543 length:174 start_codon:yes stop_codon:yes gene_type:complete
MDTTTLLEQRKWLVPQICSLKFQLQNALSKEKAELVARMKTIVSTERSMRDEKVQVG